MERKEDINQSMSGLPDLVRDSRLETVFRRDSITHLYRDRPGRSAPRHEHWSVKRALGRGSFGIVSLLEAGGVHDQPNEKRHRAVKEIFGPPAKHLESYKHELEALAKFSHQKVCLAPII